PEVEERRMARIRLLQWHSRHHHHDRFRHSHGLLPGALSPPLLRSVCHLTGARVELITIGDELLLGFTIDTNAAHISRTLAEAGIEIVRRTTVGDEADKIAAAVGEALERTGAVITTGGLGPTSDDLTKPSIAVLFGRDMVLDEEHLTWMRERWLKRFNRPMPESNRQQAMIPRGARKLTNNHGSA